MVISINDEEKVVKPNLSIKKLLDELELSNTQGMAVAINNQIVFRENRETTKLQEGDKVLIISAAKGG